MGGFAGPGDPGGFAGPGGPGSFAPGGFAGPAGPGGFAGPVGPGGFTGPVGPVGFVSPGAYVPGGYVPGGYVPGGYVPGGDKPGGNTPPPTNNNYVYVPQPNQAPINQGQPQANPIAFSAIINSTSGNDTLQGGDQNTNFYFSFSRQAPVTLGGTDTVTDLGGQDRVTFSSLSDVKLVIASANPGINNDATNVVVTETNLAGNQAIGSITIARSIEQISASDVVVDASNVDNASINPALTGITQTQGASKGYILAGTAAGDTINAETMGLPDAVGVMIFGGDGNDSLQGRLNTSNMIFGGTGDDGIVGANLSNIVFGGDGNDTIRGLAGNDTLDGNNGNDTIIGGDGNDIIKGQMGNDAITGEGGNDEIFLGQDASNANEGNDIVRFSQIQPGSMDTVHNFSVYSGGIGDRVQFVADAMGALDDGAGPAPNQLFSWDTTHNSGGVIDLRDGHTEAVYVNFRTGSPFPLASGAVDGNALAVWANNGGNALTAANADALFVVATTDAKTLVYSYAETNATVEAGDFSLLATLDVSLTGPEATTSIVLA